MIEARSMKKSIGRGIVSRLEFLGLRIRGLTILNNTPAFLYVSQDETPSRSNCVFQVEPYTLMAVPCDYPDGLYIVDGELIAPLEDNAKATLFWSEEAAALNVQRIRRNVEYVLSDGGTGAVHQFKALDLQPKLQGQVIDPGFGFIQGGNAAQIEASQQYVLPGFATHRTLYAALEGDATFQAGTCLEGLYAGAWRKVLDLPTGGNSMTVNITDMALPEQVQLKVVPSTEGTPLYAVIRFDL